MTLIFGINGFADAYLIHAQNIYSYKYSQFLCSFPYDGAKILSANWHPGKFMLEKYEHFRS